MNTTLKSSKLVPFSSNPDNGLPDSLPSLKLIPENNQPNPQQRKTISQIYVEQAWIYFQDRNWRGAIAACKNALQLDTQNTDAYKILGNILKRKGRTAEALGVYAKALEINPNSAPIYANLGSFYAEQKNWQQALDYYQQAVIIDPQLAGAYRSLARIWEELGNTQQALECLCQAVNLDPKKFSATEYFSFGDRLYAEGKLKEASIFYTRGVELNPQASEKLARLVEILEKLEEWQQAVVFYHKLMSLSAGESPDDYLALAKPIKHLLSKSQIQSTPATKSQQQVIQQSPRGIAPAAKTVVQGGTQAVTQNLTKIEASSAKIIQRAPENKELNSAISWHNLGTSYAQKQEWTKAISCYQESLQLNPNLSQAYRNLAKVYLKIGKKNQAILCCYKAFNLAPDLAKPEEHFGLAKQLIRLSLVDQAIVCLRHTIKLNPNFNQAYLVLGKLFNSQGKTEAAKACYAKVASRTKV